MRNLLEKKLFPYVIKPGRYTGGEPGQIVKNPHDKLKYLHAFPDKYELGQSYLGLQILYHIINSDDRFLCERVFAVDRDAEKRMRAENIPLFSLESSRPAKEFDAIGFTLTYELVFTNVLAMLDLANIPIYSHERTDDHPIIMAGGPAVYNPDSMADFIDIFFIGDGEEGLPELLSVLYNHQSHTRIEKLKEICRQVESVYIPAFYDNEKKPLFDYVPTKIKARIVKELKPEYYTYQPILPLTDITHRHLSVEIMRGCPQGCRFCQAGPIYRPVRIRSLNDIVEQVEKQLASTGHEEVTLLSLSSSDYPEIEKLAATIAIQLEKQRVSISLPSLRPGTISSQLLDAVSKIRKGGLTISPEAGTERLRLFIRKDFSDTAIYNSTRIAFEKGWTTIKLYFMIGLPTETEQDLQGIVNIIKNIYEIGQQYPGKKTINVTLSPFVPKPHTPFQWDEIASPDTVLQKIKFIKKNTHINQVNFKYPLTESSLLQGLLGRGGREMGKVIFSAYNKGCRFDGWNEDFIYDKWEDAFDENNIDTEELLKPIPFDAPLPWSHIKKGVSTEQLQKERQRCSSGFRKDSIEINSNKILTSLDNQTLKYGRRKKKVPLRTSTAPNKNRIRVHWGKDAQLKYMSHLDNIRMIERTIRRARMPVLYSQGYNPTMKISFGPPLQLGFTSQAEYVDITFSTSFLPSMIENMKQALPEGMSIFETKVIMSKASLTALLNRVIYRLDMNDLLARTSLINSIDSLLNADILNVDRVGKNKTTTVDIRHAIYDLHLEDNFLLMTLGIGEGGYARPSEVMTLLLGSNFDLSLLNSIHRCEVFRVNEQTEKISAMDL